MQVDIPRAPSVRPVARPPGDAVLDVGVVRRLRSIPGRTNTLFDELAPIFLASTPQRIGRLRSLVLADGIAASTATAVDATADLAAMCACLGATRMERAAVDLRRCIARPCADPRDRLAMLGRLEAEFRLVENALVALRTG